MKFVTRLELTIFLLFAGPLYLMVVAEYQKCYNTSTEMHCFLAPFSKTIFDSARELCINFNSTLLIVKDEETNQMITQFLYDLGDPNSPPHVWLDAYLANNYVYNAHTWYWVDSTLPTVPGTDITFKSNNSNWYVAAVAFRNNGFYLTALQPYIRNSYICEYEVSTCSSISSSNVRQFDGRCYVAINESVSWYEARSRCLKGGGDLASFVNVRSTNFTSWLRADPSVSFWIGLRFSWYKWMDTGEEVKYANWVLSESDVNAPCAVVLYHEYIPSWKPFDCTDLSAVICHTATSLGTTTKSIIGSRMPTVLKPTFSAGDVASTATFSIADDRSSRDYSLSLGIGLGLGLGVPLAIVTILILVLLVKYKRLSTQLEEKSRNERYQLGAVQQPKVGQESESTDREYQRNVIINNNISRIYDELNEVGPDDGYLEISTFRADAEV